VAVASAGPYTNLHLAADRQPRQHPTTQLPPAIAIENTNSQCFVIMVKDGDCEQSSDVATSKQQEGSACIFRDTCIPFQHNVRYAVIRKTGSICSAIGYLMNGVC